MLTFLPKKGWEISNLLNCLSRFPDSEVKAKWCHSFFLISRIKVVPFLTNLNPSLLCK
jgi:hypothetical protein